MVLKKRSLDTRQLAALVVSTRESDFLKTTGQQVEPLLLQDQSKFPDLSRTNVRLYPINRINIRREPNSHPCLISVNQWLNSFPLVVNHYDRKHNTSTADQSRISGMTFNRTRCPALFSALDREVQGEQDI